MRDTETIAADDTSPAIISESIAYTAAQNNDEIQEISVSGLNRLIDLL